MSLLRQSPCVLTAQTQHSSTHLLLQPSLCFNHFEFFPTPWYSKISTCCLYFLESSSWIFAWLSPSQYLIFNSKTCSINPYPPDANCLHCLNPPIIIDSYLDLFSAHPSPVCYIYPIKTGTLFTLVSAPYPAFQIFLVVYTSYLKTSVFCEPTLLPSFALICPENFTFSLSRQEYYEEIMESLYQKKGK